MKERPILFSGAMVRAILDGRKTMTRRIVNPQPVRSLPHTTEIPGPIDLVHPLGWRWRDCFWADTVGGAQENLPYHSPYGVPGDRLWVRETHLGGKNPSDTVWYRASEPARIHSSVKWTPSIFMKRHASRLTLEVTGVRVERLQQLTSADIEAEGIPAVDYSVNDRPDVLEAEQRAAFVELWDSINGKRAPWAENPWVWVVGFRRLEAAERAA